MEDVDAKILQATDEYLRGLETLMNRYTGKLDVIRNELLQKHDEEVVNKLISGTAGMTAAITEDFCQLYRGDDIDDDDVEDVGRD